MRIIIKFLFKIFAIILYRPKIKGKENIPKDGAAILCANHVHFFDSAIIVAMFRRKVNVLAKEELFNTRFNKWFAKIFGIYPIKRGKADIGAIKISLKLMKENELLLLFPEGTRNGLEKGVKPKSGAILMAVTSGVPIIPIGVQGSFKPFRKVIINVGKPIDYSAHKRNIKDKNLLDDLTKNLMDEIVKLRDNTK